MIKGDTRSVDYGSDVTLNLCKLRAASIHTGCLSAVLKNLYDWLPQQGSSQLPPHSLDDPAEELFKA